MNKSIQCHGSAVGSPARSAKRAPRIVIAALALSLAVAPPAHGQSYTVLYSFQCAPSDAAGPLGTLVEDKAGNIYGISEEGGAFNFGAVFKLASNGGESLLYSFAGTPDGSDPIGGLVRDNAGTLYGVTLDGGAFNLGTVFKVSPTGKELRLHNFEPTGTDGNSPIGLLARDSSGNLYGLTNGGGRYKDGTLYEVMAGGGETILSSFGNYRENPEYPYSGLLDVGGNFYGMSTNGGSRGLGTVFEVTASGTQTVLHSFAGAPDDGAGVVGALARDPALNLYGATSYGGNGNCPLSIVPGCGAAFKTNSQRKEGLLYSFMGAPDGQLPAAGPVRDPSGNLYGTTFLGGTGSCSTSEGSGCGTIYKIAPNGGESVLYSFEGTPDGADPSAPLLLDSSGSLYGTTLLGGNYGCGTVFKYTP